VSIVICHHCGDPINTDNVPYYTMAHCVGSRINTGHIKSLAFHQECFVEVAGEDYADDLQPDENVVTSKDVEDAFDWHNMSTSASFIPPVPQKQYAAASRPGNVKCNLCLQLVDKTEIVGTLGKEPICRVCNKSLFGDK
jgi:hypothetical protein